MIAARVNFRGSPGCRVSCSSRVTPFCQHFEIGGQAVVRDQPGSVLLPALPQRYGPHFSGGDEFVNFAPADTKVGGDLFRAQPFGAGCGFHGQDEAHRPDCREGKKSGLSIIPFSTRRRPHLSGQIPILTLTVYCTKNSIGLNRMSPAMIVALELLLFPACHEAVRRHS